MRLFPLMLFSLAVSLPSLWASSMALAEPGDSAKPSLSRLDFNRLAQSSGFPVFWRSDVENPGVLDPEELAVVGAQDSTDFVEGGAFTEDFKEAYQQLIELKRQESLYHELRQGRPALIETDLAPLSKEDQSIIRELWVLGEELDALYQKQSGDFSLKGDIPADDLLSLAVYARNQSVSCVGPKTQGDPFCNASHDFQEALVDVWPPGLDAEFCEKIGKEENAKELLSPFTVVRNEGGSYIAIPYHEHYQEEMASISKRLKKVASLIRSKDNQTLKAYLEAVGESFVTGDWVSADEAWSKMNADNSHFYLRVGPDETYWDPCQIKAGFHMSFALIDKGALEWKRKLSAIRTDMEKALAKQIGAPYKARQVNFELPEFIDIVLNAGNSRSPMGGTIGQALPNFGKVAEESRGRTVAMANLYTDADSLSDFQKRDQLLWSEKTLAFAGASSALDQLGTVLHEATHNLGPYGSTFIDGKSPQDIFGGKIDAILEELKAQTGALWFMQLLVDKGLLSEAEMRASWIGNISWAFGHIGQGMFDGEGNPKTYSQLAAIQIGELMRHKALLWVESPGPDVGRFEIDFKKMGGAIGELMKTVGQIKAKGDLEAAKALISSHTSEEALRDMHASTIQDRVLRFTKASFIYGLKD